MASASLAGPSLYPIKGLWKQFLDVTPGCRKQRASTVVSWACDSECQGWSVCALRPQSWVLGLLCKRPKTKCLCGVYMLYMPRKCKRNKGNNSPPNSGSSVLFEEGISAMSAIFLHPPPHPFERQRLWEGKG